MQAYEQAIRLDPGDVQTHRALSKAFYSLKSSGGVSTVPERAMGQRTTGDISTSTVKMRRQPFKTLKQALINLFSFRH